MPRFPYAAFTIKIWARPGTGDSHVTSPAHSAVGVSPKREPGKLEEGSKLVFEKTLDLADLVYLGTLVCCNMDFVEEGKGGREGERGERGREGEGRERGN